MYYNTANDIATPEQDLLMEQHGSLPEGWSPIRGGLELEGTDDREGELVYSHRLDGGSWSSWSEETGAVYDALSPGPRTLEAKARDRWWNEDPSPASMAIDIDEPHQTKEEESGCGGCSSAEGRTLPAALLALLVGSPSREG